MAGDDFARAASRQLLWLFLGAALLFGVVLVAMARLADTGGAATAVDPVARSITLAMASEPPQLDSTKATDQVSGGIIGHVMEGLLRYGPDGGLIPGVAEDWSLRDDGATFRLRKDARWSNGEPVTADDFVFAWRKVVDPKNASEYAFLAYTVKNGEAINNGKLPTEALGVRALDAHTLEVAFERPIPYFEQLMAFPTFFPVNERFYASREGHYGADADDLLYNGPFTITRWVHGASLRMDRNPHYWRRDDVHLNTINYAYITNDANAVLNLFKDGKIAITGINVEHLDNALEQHWPLQAFQDGSVFYMELNFRDGRLTTNRHLRKALQLAFDAGELVYKVNKVPGNQPADSLFPTWLMGVHDRFRKEYPAPPMRQDLDEARHQLRLAMSELGLTEPPTLVLLTGDNPASNRQSEYLQEHYRRTLGINLKIDRQIFKQRLAKMTLGDFDIVMAGWGPDYADPLTFGDLFASWNLNNRGRYANPQYDRWVRIAQSSLDPRERMAAFAEMQRIIHDDVPIIPQYERGAVFVMHPQLRGMVRRSVGTDPDYAFAWIDEG